MRLTIGIPSYNEGDRIISLIRSVYESTLNADEVRISEVIICDHSSDSTPQILRSFMSQHRYLPIHLVHHDERGGAASAWNEIFSLATGDIIVLFDADVLPLKECIGVPLVVQVVSGEYLMLMMGEKIGVQIRDGSDELVETLISIKRAGSDRVITYIAMDLLEQINKRLS